MVELTDAGRNGERINEQDNSQSPCFREGYEPIQPQGSATGNPEQRLSTLGFASNTELLARLAECQAPAEKPRQPATALVPSEKPQPDSKPAEKPFPFIGFIEAKPAGEKPQQPEAKPVPVDKPQPEARPVPSEKPAQAKPPEIEAGTRRFEGTGTEGVSQTRVDGAGQLDRVQTRDGRVFQRTGAEWAVTRNGQTERVSDVQVAQNGDLSYRPANDTTRRIRETEDGRSFVTGTDNVERQYVDAGNFEAQPRAADRRPGMFGNLEAVPAPEGHAGPTRYEPVGGQVRNGTNHPLLVLGNGRDGEHGTMRSYVIAPGNENNPRLSDVDAVVTDPRFQPIVSSSGRTLIPSTVPPDARAVKIKDTGSTTVTGGYSELDVSGGWIMRSSGTVDSLRLSGGQPVSPEPRARR